MKKYSIAVVVFFFTNFGFAQQDVYLRINHALGANHFALYQNATNNLGDIYQFERVEYYISEVTILHDGGQDTTIGDLWILANATSTTSVLLGNFNFTSVEGIRFGIGVDSASNHLDPASYSLGHPLAPQSPSMHWGWTAGYRFVAFEGKTGASMNDVFQLHALGDGNYYTQQINTAGTIENGNLIIDLDADYQQGLENITVSPSLIIHGEGGDAAKLLTNFRDFVFTVASGNIGLEESKIAQNQIFPNPLKKGQKLTIQGLKEISLVRLFSMHGQLIYRGNVNSLQESLKRVQPGNYLLSIEYGKNELSNQQLIIID